MKNKLLKSLVVLLMIFALTMPNYMMVASNLVTYAEDIISEDVKTNNKNVEFSAYFKENESVTRTTEKSIDADDMSIFVKIAVKNQGYLNGKITIENSNLVLKSDILSNKVNKIENNTVTLNQINAGETCEIEIAVKAVDGNNINAALLNNSMKISLAGTYRDSSEKDINISSEKDITLKLVSPYSDDQAILESNVITNKIYKINGEDKNVIQVLINSGITGYKYPISETNINISTPNNIESASVSSRGTYASNGKDETNFGTDNWKYDKNNNLISISMKNIADDKGMISWNKEQDSLVLTMIFDSQTSIDNTNIKINSQIKLFDETATTMNKELVLELKSDIVDGIVSSTTLNGENSIYKGKIYSGDRREYTQTTKINIDFKDIIDSINVSEEQPIYLTKKGSTASNIKYSSISINKNNMLNILGQDGYVVVKDNSNNILKTINSTSEVDSNGKIKVNFESLVSSIKYETSKPLSTGILKIDSTKVIEEKVNIELARTFNAIEQTVKVKYLSNENKESEIVNKSKIELKETNSRATIEVNKQKLSTISENKNVEIKAVLDTSSEQFDLYKNPTLKIKFPSQIKEINVNSINLMYEDKMVVNTAKMYVENGSKVIELKLTGEQTTYKDNFITSGTTIVINANIKLDNEIATSLENIELTFSNEKSVSLENNGIATSQIELEAPSGMITLNSIDEYGILAIGNQDNKVATLDVGTESKETEIEIGLINNNGKEVNDVKVLGELPVSTDENNIDSKISKGISVEGVNSELVKVYYSSNVNATEDINNSENGWTQSQENAKKYLIQIDSMQNSESVKATYSVEIPENLEYNVKTDEGYTVTFNNTKTGFTEKTDSSIVTMQTGTGPEISAKLTASVGNDILQNNSEIKAGEIIKYKVEIENVGTLSATGAKMKLLVPEGTTLLNEILVDDSEVKPVEHFKELADKEILVNYDEIKVGEKQIYEYLVRANKDVTDNTKISNKAEISYNELSAQSNEISNLIRTSDIKVTLYRADDQKENVKAGYGYRYNLIIENVSNSDQKNVKIDLTTNNELIKFTKVIYINSSNESIISENIKSFEIPEIKANSKLEITLNAEIGLNTESSREEVKIDAKATYGNNSYRANEVIESVEGFIISATMKSSNSNGYVQVGDILTYNIEVSNLGTEETKDITIKDKMANYLTIENLLLNGKAITVSNKKELELTKTLLAGEKLTITVKAKITSGEAEDIQLKNIAQVVTSDNLIIVETEQVTHILKADKNEYGVNDPIIDTEDGTTNPGTTNPGDDNDDNNNPSDPSDPSNPSESSKYTISGIAWIDENENGKIDSSEKTLSNIEVKLINVDTNKYVTIDGNEVKATTSADGTYVLNNIIPGKYIVVFMYDTESYILTKYQAEGVLNSKNSDAMSNNITIDGQKISAGNTDIITVESSNLTNIDIGLVQAQIFDLQLDKYVSKIIVQNKQGTSEYKYDSKTLAKVELAAKYITGTTVLVEYKMVVTNKGEVNAYAKNIVDYLPADLKFSSELNKDWYQSGTSLYTTALANTEIAQGKTAEVTLTLTKTMTEQNTGLVNNTAEISESYNKLGIVDINSTEGNNTKGENDMGSADVIIGVKTGVVYTYLFSTFAVIALVGFIGFIAKKKSSKITNLKGGRWYEYK